MINVGSNTIYIIFDVYFCLHTDYFLPFSIIGFCETKNHIFYNHFNLINYHEKMLFKITL